MRQTALIFQVPDIQTVTRILPKKQLLSQQHAVNNKNKAGLQYEDCVLKKTLKPDACVSQRSPLGRRLYFNTHFLYRKWMKIQNMDGMVLGTRGPLQTKKKSKKVEYIVLRAVVYL